MSLDDHDVEIEAKSDGTAYVGGPGGTLVPMPLRLFRSSCSCGYQGPWYKTRRSAMRDGEAHEERIMAGEVP